MKLTLQDKIKLNNHNEFDRRFIYWTQRTDTYEEAYEKVEEEYRSVFHENKYSNYNSYRNTRRKRIKKEAE